MQLPPLATTSIGSFPRPHWLAKTNVTRASFVVPPETMQEACDDATALVLRQQEKLGLDLVTDGEQRREGFIFHIAGQWNVVDTQTLKNKERSRTLVMNQMVPRIVGKITRRSAAAWSCDSSHWIADSPRPQWNSGSTSWFQSNNRGVLSHGR